jgi:fructose-1,6-bisphosphatase
MGYMQETTQEEPSWPQHRRCIGLGRRENKQLNEAFRTGANLPTWLFKSLFSYVRIVKSNPRAFNVQHERFWFLWVGQVLKLRAKRNAKGPGHFPARIRAHENTRNKQFSIRTVAMFYHNLLQQHSFAPHQQRMNNCVSEGGSRATKNNFLRVTQKTNEP